MLEFHNEDSKTLTEEKRESLFAALSSSHELLGWKVEILSPNFISNSMLQRYVYMHVCISTMVLELQGGNWYLTNPTLACKEARGSYF